MATALNTGSTLSLPSGTNKTSVGLSTNIIILVNNQAVGAIQSLQITENRQIKMLDEVGTDGHIDSSPVQSTNITGTATRIRFDNLRIAAAFSRAFVHASSQIYPFDIVILDKQKRATASQISTVIKNVWIRSIEYSYTVSDWMISETMQFEAETIYSILNGGTSANLSSGVSAVTGGERNIKHMGNGPNGTGNIVSGDGLSNVESLVDTGANGLRGSLSISGLIDLGVGNNLF